MGHRLLLILFLGLLTSCTRLFFAPSTQLLRTPADLGLNFEDIWIASADGVRLHAWYLPAVGKADGTLLFLHGNAQNISTHIGSVAWLPARGFNVMLLDYRGYGRSSGSPSVEGALRDIDAALGYLLQRSDTPAGSVTLYGQSLGGTLAILYAAQSTHRTALNALICDSAFSDFRGIAREKLSAAWWLRPLATPLSWTVTDAHHPTQAIRRLAGTPLLLIHGEADTVVPVSHALALHAAAGAPKRLWTVPGARHIGALGDETIRERFTNFLRAPRP